MKTIPALFVLFFTLTCGTFAKVTDSYDYGSPNLLKISGAESSNDGDWIRYGGNLYHNINAPILRGEAIQFGKGAPVIGAKSSTDLEFLYWGRNNYQMFRTDWRPVQSPSFAAEKAAAYSQLKMTMFGIFGVWFICLVAKATKSKPDPS